MNKTIAVIALIVLAAARAGAQEPVPEFRAEVGQELCVELSIAVDGAQARRLSGEILLSNSSVYYPEHVAGGGRLERAADTLYRFAVTLLPDTGGSLRLRLCGEALAGNDSLCMLRFRALQVDSQDIAERSIRIISRSVGPPLPYIRMARMYPLYPNPLRAGEIAYLHIRIDKASHVRFRVINLLGQSLAFPDYGELERGEHRLPLRLDAQWAPGAYRLYMITNSGNAEQTFVIIQ